MEDDVDAPHSYEFIVSSNASLSDVFSHLEQKSYLASVAGFNHSWSAIVNAKTIASFKSNNKQPDTFSILKSTIAQYANDGVLKIRFKYKSSAT